MSEMSEAEIEEIKNALEENLDELNAIEGVIGSGVGLAADGEIMVVQLFVESNDDIARVMREGTEILGSFPLRVLASDVPEASDDPPIIFTDVTIQESGVIPLPFGIELNAMTDPQAKTCTYTMLSFAMTEPEARDNLNAFLELLIKTITPVTGR